VAGGRLAVLLDPRGRGREAQLAHALRRVPLFQELPPDDLVAVWRCVREVRQPAGAVVCELGAPGDRFYVVRAGTLEVRLGRGPAGVPIRRLLPGDAFGEMALLSGAPRSADVVAAEETVLWALERRDFEALTARRPALLRAINRDLCARIESLTQEVADLRAQLGQGSAGVAGLRFGPYRPLEQIGAGGQAVVYSAVHTGDETAAAVKVLPAVWGDAPELRQRLAHEASLLRGLHHPGVVRVLAVGEVDARAGGGCYIAMEWLPHALDRVLRAQYPDPLPGPRALALVRAVAEALAAVHAAGIVHRDVKPSNILLRADGAPVLTDFGVALARARAAEGGRLTAADVVLGSADYLSPEQVAGLAVDGRSDLYALGVVLYELLSGHVPFAGRPPLETLRAHVEAPPPPLPPAVPPAARTVVERALEKLPGRRFPSAEAMAEALAAAGAAGR
jgi:CRP-like cAMP-binding protein